MFGCQPEGILISMRQRKSNEQRATKINDYLVKSVIVMSLYHAHWRAAVNLDADESAPLDGWIHFFVVRRLRAVERQRNVVALGMDDVIVPIAGSDDFLHLGLIGPEEDLLAS